MLINAEQNSGHVEFVSYTGKWPNLCSGVLTLKINGILYKFGHNYSTSNWETDGNFEKFWRSGGECSLKYISEGEWIIDAGDIPEVFREYAAEIDSVFNGNVPFGCCGGCR